MNWSSIGWNSLLLILKFASSLSFYVLINSYIFFSFLPGELANLESVTLGEPSTRSAELGKSGLDNLLSSTDGGKYDYDW